MKKSEKKNGIEVVRLRTENKCNFLDKMLMSVQLFHTVKRISIATASVFNLRKSFLKLQIEPT